MSDPARIRYLVEHYPQLQGLRLVPLGLVFLAVALWHEGQLWWLPGTADGGIRMWFLGALAFAVLASYGIGAYYRHRFGELALAPYRSGGPHLLANAVVIFVSLVLQDAFNWSVSLPLIVVGILLARVGVTEPRMRGHYLAIAVACFIMANIANVGVAVRTQRVMLDLLIAGGLLVAGIGDHLVLKHMLRRPERPVYVDPAV